MIQHPLFGMHVVLIKTAGGRKAGVCYNCGYSMTVPVSGNRGLPNRYVCFISLQHQCWMLPDCKRFITIMEEAEADYVIKAGFPETTYIIVANFTYIFCVANITKSAFLRQNITKLVNVSGLVTKSSLLHDFRLLCLQIWTNVMPGKHHIHVCSFYNYLRTYIM